MRQGDHPDNPAMCLGGGLTASAFFRTAPGQTGFRSPKRDAPGYRGTPSARAAPVPVANPSIPSTALGASKWLIVSTAERRSRLDANAATETATSDDFYGDIVSRAFPAAVHARKPRRKPGVPLTCDSSRRFATAPARRSLPLAKPAL